MGRHKITGETTMVRLAVGTLRRVEHVLGTLRRDSTGEYTAEKTSEFIRAAIERELERRERRERKQHI
jgi:hypothetical protein